MYAVSNDKKLSSVSKYKLYGVLSVQIGSLNT